MSVMSFKPRTHVLSNLSVIDLRLDVRNGYDSLQQKFQHAEQFTCDPLIPQLIFIRFLLLFLAFHELSTDSSYNISSCHRK